MKTERYKCQSYYDDNNILNDCTCGKCGELKGKYESRCSDCDSLINKKDTCWNVYNNCRIEI